jgi:hypothetical protein
MATGIQGRKDGFSPIGFIDENGLSYGIKHTSNCPHVLISDGTDTVGVLSDGSISVNPAYGTYTYFNKFGAAPDFDTGDGEITVWDGAEDGTAWELMNYIYSTTAAIDTISSNNGSDTQDIEIQGLDGDYNLVIQTATLSGTSKVTLSTPLLRVFRAKNVGSSNLNGHVFVYEDVGAPGGVPSNANLIRAVIHPENNQTEMAVFTVPNGFTGYLNQIYTHSAGATRSAEYIFKLKAKPNGQVFQLKHRGVFDDDIDKGHTQNFLLPLSFTEKTDIELTCEILTASVTPATIIGWFSIVLVPN